MKKMPSSTVSARITLPTRDRKMRARSHRPMATSRGLGMRYDGSSISSGWSVRSRRKNLSA
ncbi:hypothetical protein D3C72_2394660 [compost metagenome]